MQERFRVAEAAIREAGSILRERYLEPQVVTAKGEKDVVLSADIASEKVLLKAVMSAFPSDQIMSEESGMLTGDRNYLWIIDPLDGTVNYLNRIPYFAVSICLLHRGELVFAIVYNPLSEEFYSAQAGKGATLNGSPTAVSNISVLSDSLIAYASSAHSSAWMVQNGGSLFLQLLEAGRAVRLQGSSLLDMCGIASGRFDGLIKLWPKYWDIAAGCLIIREAGGVVTDHQGSDSVEGCSLLVASNGQIHQSLLSSLKLN